MDSKRQEGVFTLPVREFLTPRSKIQPLKESDTVKDALIRFKAGPPVIVVVDGRDQVVGILTASDVDRMVKAFDEDENTPIRNVMTPKPYIAYDDEPVESAALTMKKMGFSFGVPVVTSGTNRYVGFLYRSDVARQVDTYIKGLRSTSKTF